jgi:hypothetical protein
LREFIADSLYKRTESYFSSNAPVGYLKEPLDFNNMFGAYAYRVRILFSLDRFSAGGQLGLKAWFLKLFPVFNFQTKLYEVFEDIDGFMTPVEIFKPYYAQAICRYAISTES